jgi:GGDEF domain-containing protein
MYCHLQSGLFPDIEHLIYVLELRDSYTQGHSSRVADFAYLLASLSNISLDECNEIYIAALLHDVGKIGIPDTILLKPGKLEDDEYTLIKQHGVLSGKILEKMPKYKKLAFIVKHHHEDYNGKGYPDGLKKEEIPLGARIISIVDVFDALTSKRIYREMMPLKKALSIMNDMQNNLKFDPKLYEFFINNIDKFLYKEPIQILSKEFQKLDFLRNNFFFSDPLTKLLNRDALLTILKKCTFAKDTVLFSKLNIKEFRKYNQEYGTQKGDKLLQDVALHLKSELNAITNSKEPEQNNLFLFRVQGDIYTIVYIGCKINFIDHKIQKVLNTIYKRLGINLEYKIIINGKQVPKGIEKQIGYLL